MRHKAQVAHFGRDTDHRRAMIRNLLSSLVEHGRIETTVAKAKELRRHAERAVTMAKKGDLNAFRLLLSRIANEATVKSLIGDLGPRFKSRPGGYTRIIKTRTRVGDKAEMAFIEWVDYKLPTVEAEGDAKTAKTAKKKTVKKAAGTGKKKASKKASAE